MFNTLWNQLSQVSTDSEVSETLQQRIELQRLTTVMRGLEMARNTMIEDGQIEPIQDPEDVEEARDICDKLLGDIWVLHVLIPRLPTIQTQNQFSGQQELDNFSQEGEVEHESKAFKAKYFEQKQSSCSKQKQYELADGQLPKASQTSQNVQGHHQTTVLYTGRGCKCCQCICKCDTY